MNYRMISRLLSTVLRFVALFMLPALIICLFDGDYAAVRAFAVSIGLMLAISFVFYLFKPTKQTLYAREGFIVVALAWLMVSALGALPFKLSGAIPHFVDCLFETISGFTTTGASILTDVEAMPRGLLYWRSFTHWLGGMGVLVFLLAVSTLSAGAGDSLHIMRAESPGPQVNKIVPHTRQSARILYAIYIGLTVLQFLLLIIGGMPVFDAVTISLGTAGTGGFAVLNSSIAAYSPYLQWVITIFMTLFGINFGVYYLILHRSWRKAARNEELWLYLGVFIVSGLLIFFSIKQNYYDNSSDALRHSFFQVASIMTTTGFATADFDVWPQAARTLLVVLMVLGACAGSTGGGIKCSRALIILKSLRQEIRRMLHPNTVSAVHMDEEALPDATIRNTYAFICAYLVITVVSLCIVSLDDYSFTANFTSVMACLNNIGPGLDVVGPLGNYSGFSDVSKLVLCFDMLIGRLEIFPLLMLFVPGVWRRARV